MIWIDWIVLFGTLSAIVIYGTWKSRGSRNMQGYVLGNNTLPWWTICLSIMATQASAVTFLSVPGQAYEDGMRFLQFYFGLPLAMVIISVTAVPLYHKLKVFTAYEYLESRFDLKVRSLGASYFLMLRGISVGITLYAPSLILSAILGWSIAATSAVIGSLALIYTISGGSRAVSITQQLQLTIIMAGMITAGLIAFGRLPESVTFGNAFKVAGEMGKLNLVNLSFDLTDRYNIWSGLIGGLFLSLSYFGADQSQVGRYLGGKSVTQSRLGLIFNGLLKIPMQFLILYIGVMVFVFYQFQRPPAFHNVPLHERAMQTSHAGELLALESEYNKVFERKRARVQSLAEAISRNDTQAVEREKADVKLIQEDERRVRAAVREKIGESVPSAGTLDKDYVFINFVMTYLPHGLVGLLLAVVFSAAMSSMASELNALATTSVVDVYKRSINTSASEMHYVNALKLFTAAWAIFAALFASLAHQSENLIQFVNIVGSLFYGTILGIFISAFYIKFMKAWAVFIAGIIAELVILYLYFFKREEVAFLLYNIIGCVLVVVLGIVIQFVKNNFASVKEVG